MLFMIVGYLKPGAEAQLINFRNEFNEHLSQSNVNIVAAGALRDKDGQRRGYLGFIEADRMDDAERFLDQSPYFSEGLYDRVDVLEYEVEVGAIG